MADLLVRISHSLGSIGLEGRDVELVVGPLRSVIYVIFKDLRRLVQQMSNNDPKSNLQYLSFKP
jgi:hypothetical protein